MLKPYFSLLTFLYTCCFSLHHFSYSCLYTMLKFGQFLYDDSKQAYDEGMEILQDCWLRTKKRYDELNNCEFGGAPSNRDYQETRQVIQKYLQDLQRRDIRLSKDFVWTH